MKDLSWVEVSLNQDMTVYSPKLAVGAKGKVLGLNARHGFQWSSDHEYLTVFFGDSMYVDIRRDDLIFDESAEMRSARDKYLESLKNDKIVAQLGRSGINWLTITKEDGTIHKVKDKEMIRSIYEAYGGSIVMSGRKRLSHEREQR